VNYNYSSLERYTSDGMAQTSSFKPSIYYQVCNAVSDSEVATIKLSEPARASHLENDLSEITISSAPTKKAPVGLSSPNHHPAPRPSTGRISSSTESATLVQTRSPSSPSRNARGSTLSIHSLAKPTNSQYRPSINSLFPSSHRPSVFGTLATSLAAARKSSAAGFARLSTDHGHLFSGYQGKISRRAREPPAGSDRYFPRCTFLSFR
jgi:hypothetical protein